MRRLAALLLITFASLSVASTARADERTARKLEREAELKLDVGQFEAALQGYQRAYEQDPAPRFLFRIGECYEHLNDVDKALFYFERYAGKEVDDVGQRKAAEDRIAELRVRIAERDRGREKKRVAVLPVDAGGRAELSDQLTGLAFDALSRLDAFEVLDLITTRAELADASSMGMECAASEMKCLVKLAILLRVDQLLVVTTTTGVDGDELSLALIDATAATKLNQVTGTLPPEGTPRVTAVRGLVTRLVAPFTEGVESPSRPADPRAAPGGDVASVAPGASGAPGSSGALLWTGAALVGVGGLVALASGAGAGGIDAALLFTDVGNSPKERADLWTTERVLAGAAVGGAVLVLVGAVVLIVGWAE